MTHGKSLRILAVAALLGAVGYALLVQYQRRNLAPADGGTTTEGGAGAGGATAADIDLAIERETGAAWYCEGDTIAGAWEKAHDALERVTKNPQSTPQDLVNLACVKLKLGATDAAKQAAETPHIRELCQRALARDPKLATAHFVLGAIAMDRELDVATAKTAFEQAVANAPDDVAAKLRLADVLVEAGERDRAIEIYQQVRARGPEFAGAFYVTATYRLAQLVRRRKQGDDAKVAGELLKEHGRLLETGAPNPSDEDIKLGTLARVKLPPARGPVAKAPSEVPPVKFEALPPLLENELAEVTALEVADVTGDLRDDVVAAGRDAKGVSSLWLLAQDTRGAMEPRKLRDGAYSRVVAVDLENEFGMSLLLIGEKGVELLAPSPDGQDGFVDVTAQLPALGGVVHDVQGVDFGHDGQLDLAFATSAGVKLVRNDGVPRDQYTRDRTGPIQLKDVSGEASMPAGDVAWIAIEDFDSDQDIDLIAGGPGTPTLLLSSLRKGRFETIAPEKSGLPKEIAKEPLFADFDHDGRPDVLVAGGAGAPATLLRNRGGNSFESGTTVAGIGPLADGVAALVDLDLDGELDLATSMFGSDGGITAWFGSLHSETDAPTLSIRGRSAPGAAPRFGDLDDDGDFDLVALGPPGKGGIAIHCGSVGGEHRSLLLALRGGKDNRQAIGAIVEVRAREHFERRLATERKQLFGLGRRAAADVVRIMWPNGVVQCFVQPEPTKPLDENRSCGAGAHPAAAAGRATIVSVLQKEGLAGSCPFLYTWNGREYVFVTDVLGITPLGLPMTESMYVPPDHDELVRLTSEQLAPVDGEYRMQLTEELRETTYLDRAELWVVDHPADVEVHPEERFCFPPFPPQHVHTVRGALPLAKAVDQTGRDWTTELATEDRVHAAPFVPLDPRYQGLVTSHTLELTLPAAAKDAKKVRLLMTGWLYWSDASVNVLADRNGSIRFVPPMISVPDGAGGWRETGPPVGFPAGKTKTMVLDVTSLLNRDDVRLRIFSTIRLYWDQIRVAVDDDDAPLEITKLEPEMAKLWHRGFSAPVAEVAADQPDRFDWNVLEPMPRWNQHRGMLTRFGDVRPLLGAIDDRFVILSAGDAIDLRFRADEVAELRPGFARTYLLFLDGWAKDADPNTTYSQTVEPLPFHGMSGYPYRADETYPEDEAHAEYRIEWNTRPGRVLIPDLSAPVPVIPQQP